MRAMETSATISARSTGIRSVSGGFRLRTRRKMLIARRRRRVVRLSSRSRRMAFRILLLTLRGLAPSFAGRIEQSRRRGVGSHGLGKMLVGVFARISGAWKLGTSGFFPFRSQAGQWPCFHFRVGTQVTLITGTGSLWRMLDVILTYICCTYYPTLSHVDAPLREAFAQSLL